MRTGDYRLNAMDHPPFAEMWSALPLLFLQPRPLVFQDHPDWIGWRIYHYADYFLNHNVMPGNKMLDISRIFVFSTWTLLLFFVSANWAFQLGGAPAMIGTAVAAVLCPVLISNMALVTTDTAPTVLLFAALWLVSRYQHGRDGNRSLLRFSLAGLCVGLAMASKFNMILSAPLALGIFWLDWNLEAGPRTRFPWAHVCVFAICATAALALVYRVGHISLYAKGLAATVDRIGEGRSSFLLGSYSTTGFWLYFPVAFLVKMPLPTLILGFLGVVRQRRNLWVCGPMLVYFLLAMISKFNIGVRHLLPIVPSFLLLSGCGVAWLWNRRYGKSAVVFLSIWGALSVGRACPYLLAYFNEACGGPSHGYQVLTDSNLDWGQDLKPLARYLRTMGNPPIYFSYFGTADPSAFGIRYVPVAYPPFIERMGDPVDPAALGRVLFAVSATNLQGEYFANHHLFDWLKRRRPLTVIGYSIFVYDLTRDFEARHRLAQLTLLAGFADRAKTLDRSF